MRQTIIGQFAAWVEGAYNIVIGDYDTLWKWSVQDIDRFWLALWRFGGIVADGDPTQVRIGDTLDTTRWFSDTKLNYAEHALSGQPDDKLALLGRSETRDPCQYSWGELRAQVAHVRAGLLRLGVKAGDRVVGYLPNIPEAVIVMLACASIGAIWSSCPPEFGVRSVIDRFGQIDPVVLFTIDGYRYGGKEINRSGEVEAIRAALPTLKATVAIGYLDPCATLPSGAVSWDELVAEEQPLDFVRFPFSHPLYILYSSGTTGLPKSIMHGHGGILLTHLRDLCLHHNLKSDGRFFWFTTTGWMMWNYMVSGLLAGSAIVCFDGSPVFPDLGTLWNIAAETKTTLLGLSAPFIMSCCKAGLKPGADFDLSALQSLGSTGAPLVADGFEWFYKAVKPDIPLASISGGTDICSIFVGHAPILPVWAGEISGRALGADVHAYSADGESLINQEGEMVITQPLPSMPVGLWGDDTGLFYRQTYFLDFPGLWRHGDWITITERGSCIISGRSDATLNRGGVRFGTAEYYAIVESLPEVTDSLVIHHEDTAGGMGKLLLFIVPAPSVAVDDDLRSRITARLRQDLSPRHVPDKIIEVQAVPKTLSGKKLEVPVKRILAGQPATEVASAGSLANPESLTWFEQAAKSLDLLN